MNSKVVAFTLALLGNSFLMYAQTITDTILVTHPDVAFHKYDSLAEVLFVANIEFNASTKKWSYVLDIYGESRQIERYNEEWFIKYKMGFEHTYPAFFYLQKNPYKKQIINGEWIKGDSVKNGYWIQYIQSEELCQGFVVNGIRENNWIEYENGEKIREGNYTHNIKGGNWQEWIKSGCEIFFETTGKYKNGLKQGVWIDYKKKYEEKEKKSIRAKMIYINDTLEGRYKSWGDRGEKFRVKGWGDKKNLSEKGNYKNGLRDGEWIESDRGDTTQICFWKEGIPIVAYVYIPTGPSGTALVKHECNVVKWQFENNRRIGEWVFKSIISIDQFGSYIYWSAEYYNYWYSPYYYLGVYDAKWRRGH